MLTVSKSGKALPREARLIVYNVARYLKDKNKLYNLRYNVAESTSDATGVSASLVKTILREVHQEKLKAKPLRRRRMCDYNEYPPGEKCWETKAYEDGNSKISRLPIVEQEKDEKEMMNIVFCDVKAEPSDTIDESITSELPLDQDILETPPADISDVVERDQEIKPENESSSSSELDLVNNFEDNQFSSLNNSVNECKDEEIKPENESSSSSCELDLVNNFEDNQFSSLNNSVNECKNEGTSEINEKHELEIESAYCELCKKLYQINDGVNNHNMLYHSKARPFPPNACDSSSSRKVNLKKHALTHTDVAPFVCEYCSQCFKHWYLYNRHVKVHRGEGPYSCDKCSRSFFRLCYMRVHKC